MPRRKVAPADRIRAVQACTRCRTSKKRCDGQLPCSACVRRAQGDSCTFETPREINVVNRLTPSATSSSVQEFATTHEDADSPDEARHRIRPRLLSNSHGERVFIGSSASLAFLQFIRDLVAESIGASEFTDNALISRMHEVSQPSYEYTSSEVELDDATKLEYGQNYLIVTAGLISFVNDARLQKLLFTDLGGDTYTTAVRDMVLTIGAKASPSNALQAKIERMSLASAQVAAFSDLLENPSVMIVQVFVLLAYYMLQACRRNTAFMYVGIAARAAYALGLEGLEQHAEIWQSFVNIDVIIGSVLGRATATSSRKANLIGHISTSYEASYQMSLIVQDIIGDLYQKEAVTVNDAMMYLKRVEGWTAALPEDLRALGPPSERDYHAYKHISGCLNTSCYYHFSVILVCRPFLISHLLNCMLKERNTSDQNNENLTAQVGIERELLASKCITAAIYMTETCEEAMEAGVLQETSTIILAWVFAAGLVLGLRMFALQKCESRVDLALRSARSVLRKLGGKSTQALHYCDILNHLEVAIGKKRERLGTTKSQQASKDVQKLISFAQPVDITSSTLFNDISNSALSSDALAHLDQFDDFLDFMPDDLLGQNEVLLDWNQVDW